MKFGSFKIGKTKDKNEKENSKATQIAELEEQLNDRTDNLKQTEKKLKKLSGKVGNLAENSDSRVLPHGPIAELTLETPDTFPDAPLTADDITEVAPEASGEKVKLVEIKPEAAPPPKEAKKPDDIGDSLNKLFSNDEEEENPLANLIRSLPDVTAAELMDDLREINEIIKDWQKK